MNNYHELLPERPEHSHKGTFGRLLIIAGSSGMSGAAYLNAMAAYRSGVGVVKLYTHEDNRIILQSLVPEAIMSTYTTYDEKQLKRELKWSDVILIGSGLGTSEIAVQILLYTLNHGKKPIVIDADGINILSRHLDLLPNLADESIIFTPHLLEASRLCQKDISYIQENKDQVGNSFISGTRHCLIMKDSQTRIYHPDHTIVINPTGNCAMAKAGSGDVLAGIVAGLLAQTRDIYQASVLGTYLHGLTGDLARKDLGMYSVLARDLVEYIPKAMLTTSAYNQREVK